jgi:pectate lyase
MQALFRAASRRFVSLQMIASLAVASVAACSTATQPLVPIAVADATDAQSIASAQQTQQARDGWAAAEGPVTGGAAAISAHIYRVKNRNELSRALMAGGKKIASATPKVIFVEGTIDLSVDDNLRPLVEDDYRDAAFNWNDYAAAFDAKTWGKKPVDGPLEDARKRSADRQLAVVVLQVGSNTSLIGVGKTALIKNGSLMVKNAENVILRNLAFEDAYDYFPQWDPKDNANGEWNSEYDNVTIYTSRRVWVDRCTFSDGARPDHLNRSLLGRPMQFHDGLLDIVRGSDLVTVSNSHFKNHDKGMLIGTSDGRTDDAGKLRVTLHHNWFENIKERSPRVRYGRVHVYNNLYSATPNADYGFGYSIGIGYQSQVVAQNNVFDLPGLASPRIFKWWRGQQLRSVGNVVNGAEIDGLSQLRAQTSTAISDALDWQPTFHLDVQPPERVAAHVRTHAGAKY